MPITVLDSLPFGEDQDSTLVQANPEDWITSPFILDLLDREGQSAPSSSSIPSKPDPSDVPVVPPALPPKESETSTPVPEPEVKGANGSFNAVVAQQATPAKGVLPNEGSTAMVKTTEATKQAALMVEESTMTGDPAQLVGTSSANKDWFLGRQSLHLLFRGNDLLHTYIKKQKSR